MIKFIKKSAVALVFVVLITLLVVRPAFLSGLRRFFVTTLAPPLKLTSFILSETKSLFSYRSTAQENRELKQHVGVLTRQVGAIDELLRENTRLKNLLALKYEVPYATVAARIIGRDPSNWSSVVLIDKGSDDRIRSEMPVITEAGLAGKVFEVGSSISKVLLINDPNVNVSAVIQRSREEGVVSGTILGDCKMRYLSRDADIEIGDNVVTSGLGKVFPKGFLVGKVSDVRFDNNGLTKLCSVRPAVNLSRLEEVLVVLK